MQKLIDDVVAEVIRVIKRPPSRPIRLMFLEDAALYEMAQNRVKELFLQNEILNMSNFTSCSAWLECEQELIQAEQDYGSESKKYQQVLCKILENAVMNFICKNNAKKVLVIEDETLFSIGVDPIHFLLTYMAENSKIINEDIPIIWLTIGTKEDYSRNEYRYYQTENTEGRIIRVTQSTFSGCVFDYKLLA